MALMTQSSRDQKEQRDEKCDRFVPIGWGGGGKVEHAYFY